MPKCNSCGATINFTITSSGKYMPVELGVKEFIYKGEVVSGQIPHWQNCHGADDHRKPKPKQKGVEIKKETEAGRASECHVLASCGDLLTGDGRV